MREELLPYVGRRLAVVGTVARFGCKPRFADLYERTVLLTDVRMIDGTPITDHVWFTMGARLAAADPHRGDVLAQQVREIHQTVQAALRPNAPYSPLDPTWGGWGMQLLEDDARDAALYAREALALERVYRLRTARAPLARFRYCQDPPHAGGGVCPGGRGSGGPGGPRRRPDVLPAAGGMMDKQIIPVGAGQRDPRTFLIREWRVLYAIGAHQERHGAGPTWSALGRAEGLGPSSLRRVLARLEREGEIARAPHTTHGLMLTAQGRASYATLRGMLGRALCQAVEKERAAMEAAE